MHVILKGERHQSKGYEPSEALQRALMTFRQVIIDRIPTAIVEFGQTDRDIEITVRHKNGNSPFVTMTTYYVWEEDGELVGSKAEGSFGL